MAGRPLRPATWAAFASPRPTACPSHRQGRRPATSLLRHDLGAVGIKAEAHLSQSSFAHGVAQPRLVFGIEHQKAAAAGADQLAADSAVVAGEIVPGIDLRVRRAAGALALV